MLLLVCSCGVLRPAAQVHTDFKAKNFPSASKADFTAALTAYKEGERQFKLLIKDGNTDNIPAIMAHFRTAYALNPDHIALNRYITTLLLLQKKNVEAFPYLEKLYDLKADLSSD